jgi:hypothetical protein
VPTRRTEFATAAATAGALLLSGCGSLDADAVENVATTFADGGTAATTRCRLLAEKTLTSLVEDAGTACEEAIGDLPIGTGTPTSVEVWGEEAQVKLADDTLFLTRTSDGWKVMAAACRPQAEQQPYDCQLEGS